MRAGMMQPDLEAAGGDMAGGTMVCQGSVAQSSAEAAAVTEAQHTCHSLNHVVENLLMRPLTQL